MQKQLKMQRLTMTSKLLLGYLFASNIKLTYDRLLLAIMGVPNYKGVEAENISNALIVLVDFLNYIGVPSDKIADIISNDEQLSDETLAHLQIMFREQGFFDNHKEFLNLFPRESHTTCSCQGGGADMDSSLMPARKAGYKRVLVIRNGKKKWINKRNPNKKIRLSPKQKMALRKARLKAHTASAKIKRARSSRLAKH